MEDKLTLVMYQRLGCLGSRCFHRTLVIVRVDIRLFSWDAKTLASVTSLREKSKRNKKIAMAGKRFGKAGFASRHGWKAFISLFFQWRQTLLEQCGESLLCPHSIEQWMDEVLLLPSHTSSTL